MIIACPSCSRPHSPSASRRCDECLLVEEMERALTGPTLGPVPLTIPISPNTKWSVSNRTTAPVVVVPHGYGVGKHVSDGKAVFGDIILRRKSHG